MTFSALTHPHIKTVSAAVLALGLLAALPASAGIAVEGWTRSSTVTDTVTDNGNGTWSYQYTVTNTSQRGGIDPQEPILVD